MRRLLMVPVVALGVLIGFCGYLLPRAYPMVRAKVRGELPRLSWGRFIGIARASMRFERLDAALDRTLAVTGADGRLERIQAPSRDFWIQTAGAQRDGRALLAYLIAEHLWMEEINPAEAVRPGDIVLDCGAHVGIFTDRALARGASKVIAIDPDPTAIECLRRNFPREIASGRVAIAPVGVWDSEGWLEMRESGDNSGASSIALPIATGREVRVRTTTLIGSHQNSLCRASITSKWTLRARNEMLSAALAKHCAVFGRN